ncbi:MAG TPA: hypothetical protein VK604_11135 [Bryobacteraceae bacterium]|nr:hypothetical protein [Bryobacteraceae bacterium]
MSSSQGRLQSTLAALKKRGLIPSPVASNPALRKRRRIQPTGDGLRTDADLVRDLELSLTLTV